MISIDNLSLSLNNKDILHDIDLTINRGDYFGLIGPNGSGKTSLLKTIAQLLAFQKGSIHIDERNLANYSNKEIARIISYVPQDTLIDFDFNVKDIVAMGRHAHRSLWRENKDDETIIKQVMLATNTWQFADKSILNLSGGQRQLVFIAKALAQDTPVILLDEPISALDVYYQMHILKLLDSLTKQGKTVIIVLHDLNLAARFCHHILLLKDGRVQASGNSKEVLTKGTLKNTYHIDAKIRNDRLIQSLNITPL